MNVSIESLNTRARELLDLVDRGMCVTVTYRGKPRAKLVSIKQEKATLTHPTPEIPVFGMWKNHEELADVELHVRQQREGRFSADR